LGIFMSHCDQVPTTLNLLHLHIKLSPYIYTAGLKWILNFDCWQIYNFADFSRSPKILSQKVRIQGYGFWSYQLHTLVHNSTSLYTTVRRGRFDYNIFCISNYTTTFMQNIKWGGLTLYPAHCSLMRKILEIWILGMNLLDT
jgi:hypothetical protein